MANGINKVILVGNLGEAPELRYMPSGAAACNFSLATSESWKDSSGQKQERTEWHRCSAFDRGNYKMAEYIAEGCQKGTKLYVEGSLQTREWEKDGIKRYTTEIKVNEFQILSGGVPRDGQQQASTQAPAQPAAQPQSFGSFDTDWSGYKPSATTNGATLDQVKKKYNGDLQAAIKNGHVEKEAFGANDFDEDIPFN